MDIIPIAFDSLGTRSMATYVEAGGVGILIDPSVSLAPSRFNLPPHPIEIMRKKEHWKSIVKYGKKADVIIVTHYHYDHHNPDFPSLYKGKVVFVKDPEKNINKSQMDRANRFLPLVERFAKKVIACDGTEQRIGEVHLRFSEPVCHGTNSKLGYVVEFSIESGDKFLFTSDVEGPALAEQTDFILKERPRIIFCDGPMTYMLGFRYSYHNLQLAKENIKRIIEDSGVEKLIIDHHLTRDSEWRKRMGDLIDFGIGKDCCVITAAGYAGAQEDILEARRRELYGNKKGVN